MVKSVDLNCTPCLFAISSLFNCPKIRGKKKQREKERNNNSRNSQSVVPRTEFFSFTSPLT